MEYCDDVGCARFKPCCIHKRDSALSCVDYLWNRLGPDAKYDEKEVEEAFEKLNDPTRYTSSDGKYNPDFASLNLDFEYDKNKHIGVATVVALELATPSGPLNCNKIDMCWTGVFHPIRIYFFSFLVLIFQIGICIVLSWILSQSGSPQPFDVYQFGGWCFAVVYLTSKHFQLVYSIDSMTSCYFHEKCCVRGFDFFCEVAYGLIIVWLNFFITLRVSEKFLDFVLNVMVIDWLGEVDNVFAAAYFSNEHIELSPLGKHRARFLHFLRERSYELSESEDIPNPEKIPNFEKMKTSLQEPKPVLRPGLQFGDVLGSRTEWLRCILRLIYDISWATTLIVGIYFGWKLHPFNGPTEL